MKLPFSCVDYIVIHELAHIKHKNHSKSFWDWVEVHCPNYKDEEKKSNIFDLRKFNGKATAQLVF